MRLDHIGIAVRDLDSAVEHYEQLLDAACEKREYVEGEQVDVAFFEAGESKLELLASNEENSAIRKFLAKRGEGIHHIAFQVDNIESELQRMKGLGYRVLNETPKLGANNKLVAFLHPKDQHGVLIELCQTRPD